MNKISTDIRRRWKGKPTQKYGRESKEREDEQIATNYKNCYEHNPLTCSSCGLEHRRNQCPAKDKKCDYCQRAGYYERDCKIKIGHYKEDGKDDAEIGQVYVNQVTSLGG